MESLLKPLGFSLGFNPDGSNFFTNGIFKIEFLSPQSGKCTDKAVYIKPLKISATPLRYLKMLFDQQMEVEKEGFKFIVPSPWVLAYHKILITKNRRAKDKKEKDMLQAIAILREIAKRPVELKKALSYLETLPPRWKSYIKSKIYSFLATKEPGLRLGEAAQRSVWIWDNPAFKHMKKFLDLL